IFKAIKTKFGASIASHKISAQRAEAYCRAIAHNIILVFKRFWTVPQQNIKFKYYKNPEKSKRN
ncbi:MAG: hypothetical protein KKF46_03440, partial [Nanoarchaeota archaeon]|nr:hypothetical protein [Nanoarchaeota archaeon]MBU1597448.1 hypothetical protein [Nanoarchaeota archaeon]